MGHVHTGLRFGLGSIPKSHSVPGKVGGPYSVMMMCQTPWGSSEMWADFIRWHHFHSKNKRIPRTLYIFGGQKGGNRSWGLFGNKMISLGSQVLDQYKRQKLGSQNNYGWTSFKTARKAFHFHNETGWKWLSSVGASDKMQTGKTRIGINLGIIWNKN